MRAVAFHRMDSFHSIISFAIVLTRRLNVCQREEAQRRPEVVPHGQTRAEVRATGEWGGVRHGCPSLAIVLLRLEVDAVVA
jgi:hypothetical protein